MDPSTMFSGEPHPFGGLSNERELANACPAPFRAGNDWTAFAARLFADGGRTAAWRWKTADVATRRRQLERLQGLLGSFELSHEEKTAVAGWMLSEMLSEAPPG